MFETNSDFCGDGNAPYEEDYNNQVNYEDGAINKNSAESDTPMTQEADEEAYGKRGFDSVAHMLEDSATKMFSKDGLMNISGI